MAKLVIDTLPYVDGIPDEFQSRLNWIKNSEPLDGASTRFGNDGPLNRAGVQIQKNVETVDKNVGVITGAVDELTDEVELIKKSLEITGDTSAIEQVYKNKTNIENHEGRIVSLEKDTAKHETEITSIESDVGVYDGSSDGYYRTIRDNIVWIKKEMGAYPGQDINGQAAADAIGSGMKYRIMTNSDAISKQSIRLKTLEDDYRESDVGALNEEVKDIRTEIGAKSGATSASIYARLTTNADGLTRHNGEILAINQAIDYTNPRKIGVRVKSLEDSYLIVDATLNSAQNGLVPRVNTLESKIGTADVTTSIEGRLAKLTSDQKYVGDVVGNDSSSGLQGQVAWINQQVGIVPDGEPTPAGSVIDRVTKVESIQNGQMSTIQELQTEIGTTDSGLKGSIFGLQTQMNGNPAETAPVDRDGVYATVVELQSKFVTAVTDVTTDGLYLRSKGAWVKKASAVAQFTKGAFDANLVSDYNVDPNNLVAASFNSGVQVIDDISIRDSGLYCLDTELIVDTTSADKSVMVVLFVNNIEISSYAYGVKTVTGEQLISVTRMHNFSANDNIRYVLRAGNDAAKGTVKIKSLRFNIRPAV